MHRRLPPGGTTKGLNEMNKRVAKASLAVLAVGMFLMLASPAQAQTDHNGDSAGTSAIFPGKTAANLGGAIGAGLAVMGGAAGIGRIGGSTAMIITAAMIEGATLFAVLGGFLAAIAT